MATVDGFVSQHGVVGHFQAGKKEKFVDDFGLGVFGSSNLVNSSKSVNVIKKSFDPSKLRLLKKKIQQKKVNGMVYRPQLLIAVCNDISIGFNNNNNNKVTKKRRKRRKKKKLSIVRDSAFEIEIMDGVFIPSTIPVLEMECNIGVSMESTLLNGGDSATIYQSYQSDESDSSNSICSNTDDSDTDNSSLSFVASIGGRVVCDSGSLCSINSFNDEDDSNNGDLPDTVLTNGSFHNHLVNFNSNIQCNNTSDDSDGNSSPVSINSPDVPGSFLFNSFNKNSDNNSTGQDCNQDSLIKLQLYKPDKCNKPADDENLIPQDRNDDDPARQEHEVDSQADSDSPQYQQADLILPTHQQANHDLTFGNGGRDDDCLFCEQNQTPGIELHRQLQSHPGVIVNDMEIGFISLFLITKDIHDYASEYGDRIGIAKSSLQHLQVLLIDDMDTFSLSNLQIHFNHHARNNFYPLRYLADELLRKCIQYQGMIGCDQQSLKKLKFLFVDGLSSLNSPNSNKNNNNKHNNNNNNSDSRYNNGRRFSYSRRRGRKKRQYQMVYKNKLQNVKFKQFGSSDSYVSNCYNSVVDTQLVTARAPKCAPN